MNGISVGRRRYKRACVVLCRIPEMNWKWIFGYWKIILLWLRWILRHFKNCLSPAEKRYCVCVCASRRDIKSRNWIVVCDTFSNQVVGSFIQHGKYFWNFLATSLQHQKISTQKKYRELRTQKTHTIDKIEIFRIFLDSTVINHRGELSRYMLIFFICFFFAMYLVALVFGWLWAEKNTHTLSEADEASEANEQPKYRSPWINIVARFSRKELVSIPNKYQFSIHTLCKMREKKLIFFSRASAENIKIRSQYD